VERVSELWNGVRAYLATGVTLAALLAWRHEAPAWALEGLACIGAMLWIKSDE
jgi:hypothetical protein